MERPSRNVAAAVIGSIVVLAGLFFLRPVFHGLAMFFWTRPVVWLPPAVIVLVGLAVVVARAPRRTRPPGEGPAGRATDPRLDPVRRRLELPKLRPVEIDLRTVPGGPGLVAIPAVALVALIAGSIAVEPLTASALFRDTKFEEIDGLPAGGLVRVVPKDVAEQSASSGFNSPTEQLSNFSIVRTDEGLEWTALRTPNSTVRTFSRKSQGLASLDAGSSARQLELTDAEFRYAPGLQVTDNLRWQLLKRRFLIELADPVAIRDEEGEPQILVPYLKYRGFPIRRPTLGGVFVVAPDGTIEDLSPEEAQNRPDVAGSGRLFPPTLARRIQDSYAYKNGIWNKLFLHEEETRVSDTETNPQPYLVDFGERGVKWVTVAEPYGRAFAVNAIFLTDSVTGETAIWSVPDGQSLSGNRRALQTVRSLTIPGVVFADDVVRGSGGGGRFRVVEPRPVFVNGQLVYLVSIIPEQANSISKTVVIDAAQNKQVAIFNNDSDRRADDKIARYLATGELPDDAAVDEEAESRTDDADAGAPDAGSRDAGGEPPRPAEVRRQLDELIERQRESLRDAEALRRALGD
jgi:hypothetical protein